MTRGIKTRTVFMDVLLQRCLAVERGEGAPPDIHYTFGVMRDASAEAAIALAYQPICVRTAHINMWCALPQDPVPDARQSLNVAVVHPSRMHHWTKLAMNAERGKIVVYPNLDLAAMRDAVLMVVGGVNSFSLVDSLRDISIGRVFYDMPCMYYPDLNWNNHALNWGGPMYMKLPRKFSWFLSPMPQNVCVLKDILYNSGSPSLEAVTIVPPQLPQPGPVVPRMLYTPPPIILALFAGMGVDSGTTRHAKTFDELVACVPAEKRGDVVRRLARIESQDDCPVCYESMAEKSEAAPLAVCIQCFCARHDKCVPCNSRCPMCRHPHNALLTAPLAELTLPSDRPTTISTLLAGLDASARVLLMTAPPNNLVMAQLGDIALFAKRHRATGRVMLDIPVKQKELAVMWSTRFASKVYVTSTRMRRMQMAEKVTCFEEGAPALWVCDATKWRALPHPLAPTHIILYGNMSHEYAMSNMVGYLRASTDAEVWMSTTTP